MQKTSSSQNQLICDLMQSFVSETIHFYDHIKEIPVGKKMEASTETYLKNQEIPTQGRPLQTVYDEMLQHILSTGILQQHPRSFSCIPSTSSLLSWMGDIMLNAYNPHASCKLNAPSSDIIEKKLIRWMGDLAGYPNKSGGLFVSGGSIANLTALTAARDAKLTEATRSKAVIYLSDQTHSSVKKALHIIGFQTHQIHIVATDSCFAIDVAALEKAVQEDLEAKRKPFAVIASAGTTNTGSVDPLKAIGAICKTYDLWMHVDGAFGASALLSKHARQKLEGIELSDSLSWDAHKWMMQTYGCSVVLVRDRETLIKSFNAHPEYLKDAESSENSVEFWDLGPELTRPARSLKLWLTLQAVGSDAMGEMIDHGCRLAELVESEIQKSPGWEIISPASLGIVNFRYNGDDKLSDKALDQLNQAIAKEVTDSGFAQIFTTELHGHKVLRMCIIHPETTEADIMETLHRLKNAKVLQNNNDTLKISA